VRKSTDSGLSSWRRENASSRCVSAAPRWRPARHFAAAAALRVLGQALLQQRQTAEHRHQQIVEIVRDAAGQPADGVHLLRLEQLRERGLALARALLDALLELLVEALRSAAVRSATRCSSSALKRSSCRVLRYRSTNTLTLARSSSGTTGTGT
jgi:hypothetical protein